MQTDPIGYGDGLNFYDHAESDPVNGSDPNGLEDAPDPPNTIHVHNDPGSRPSPPPGGSSTGQAGQNAGGGGNSADDTIVVTGKKKKKKNSSTRPSPHTTEGCAAHIGGFSGLAFYSAAEARPLIGVAKAAMKGASTAAEVGELAGPEGMLAGAIAGGLIGGAVFYFDLGNGVSIDNIPGCP